MICQKYLIQELLGYFHTKILKNICQLNLLHFSLYQKQVIGDYSSALFLISLFFIVFATVVFCKKISGFFKRASIAVGISLLQIFLFILTFVPFSILDGINEFFTPEFIRGDQKFG